MLKIGLTIAGFIVCALICLYTYTWFFEETMSPWCHDTIMWLWISLALLQFISMFWNLGDGTSDGLY